MPRPIEVDNTKIAEYDQRIDNDPQVNKALVSSPIIREVCYAGQYLSDQLHLLECPETLIGQILYTAGQLSFGRKDPWEIHQELLSKFILDDLEFEMDKNELN